MAKIDRAKRAAMLARTFGARLRKIREERFLSQRLLAEGVGIETVQISRYERGTALPGADTLLDLATFLRVSAGSLLSDEQPTNGKEPPIHDITLLERFRDLEKLSRKDRQMVIDLIDAIIASRQIEQVATRRHRSV